MCSMRHYLKSFALLSLYIHVVEQALVGVSHVEARLSDDKQRDWLMIADQEQYYCFFGIPLFTRQ